MGDPLPLKGHGDAEDDGRQLDHHEDPEQAERRSLAEVDELDDAAHEQAGDDEQREGPDVPETYGERHGRRGCGVGHRRGRS